MRAGLYGILVNKRIWPRDQFDSPTVSDLKAINEEMADEKSDKQTSFLSMTWVFSKAHRRVEVSQKDGGLQACRIHDNDPNVYLNKCGTYGIRSAS